MCLTSVEGFAARMCSEDLCSSLPDRLSATWTWTDLPGFLFRVCQPYFIINAPSATPSNFFFKYLPSVCLLCTRSLQTLTFVISGGVEQVCTATERLKNGGGNGEKLFV